MTLSWNYVIRLRDLHVDWRDGKIGVCEVAKRLADRIEDSPFSIALEEEIEDLRNNVTDVESYDEVLERIYDYCDSEGYIVDPPESE